jgi:hypothetical protein
MRSIPSIASSQARCAGADLVQNFAVPEVRAQKLALIRELCENYDLDGLELDFLRFYSYFREKTPVEQRRAIMTGLRCREVRALLLTRTGKSGSAHECRVICPPLDLLGLDLKALVAAGLDMVNASASLLHHAAARSGGDPQTNRGRGALLRAVPHDVEGRQSHDWLRCVSVSACHAASTCKPRRISPMHAVRMASACSISPTTASTARARDVVSSASRRLKRSKLCVIRKPSRKHPQHWFIAYGWRSPGAKPLPVPRKIEVGKPAKFNFDLAALRLVGRAMRAFAFKSTSRSALMNGPPRSTARPICSHRPMFPNRSPWPYPSMIADARRAARVARARALAT